MITEADPVFFVVEQVFCTYFLAELARTPGPWQLGLGKGPAVRPVEVIRFLAFEEKPNCLKDAWFVFDLALVLMMILVRASEGSQQPANRSKSWGPRQR